MEEKIFLPFSFQKHKKVSELRETSSKNKNNRRRRIRYDTVSKQAIQLALSRESLAEEMRILYVAMTRAKEKLICVDCMRFARNRVRGLLSVAGCPAAPEAVGSAKAPGDWILLPLLCTPEAAVLPGARLDTDIACAVNAGIDSVFVLSGEGTRDDIERDGIRPTWVYDDINAVFRAWEETP